MSGVLVHAGTGNSRAHKETTARKDTVGDTIRRRATIKACRAPGLKGDNGCYRRELGQICASQRYHMAFMRKFPATWLLDPAALNIPMPHVGALLFSCSDLVHPAMCKTCFIARQANWAREPFFEHWRWRHDMVDARLVQPKSLLADAVPVSDTVLSGNGHPAIGAVVAVFLSTQDQKILNEAAWALGILPNWVPMSAISRSRKLLAAPAHLLLDRQSMLQPARSSIDWILDCYPLEDGRLAMHCPENVRLTDAAANLPGAVARQQCRRTCARGRWSYTTSFARFSEMTSRTA